MIIKPLEEFEAARWVWYQKEITAATEPVKKLVNEFKVWSEELTKKYLMGAPEENVNVVAEDGKYIVSFNLEKLLGKQ